jgi:hypothetical protein
MRDEVTDKDKLLRGVGSTQPDGRSDDRNEEIDDSPVPDPESPARDARDDPEAD